LRLQAVITQQWQAFNASFVGKTVDVLLEKPGRLTGQLVGKTPYLQTVQVMARPELIGRVLPVEITGTGTNTLFGDIAAQQYAPELATAGA
jgi:tRNA-2-methylthio-N6-dimethylallyladenosine synthase